MRLFEIVRGQQPFPKKVTKSIFLLGPIPRITENKHLSWKPEAYRILEELGYDGVVYDPEWEEAPDQGNVDYEYGRQIDWEVEAMNRADVIVAWIPRKFPEMPAMTSNIEMGEFFKSGRLLIGYPEGTQRMSYIVYRANTWLRDIYKWHVPVYGNLKEILQAALLRIGDGALRTDAETKVPLDIWQDKSFQQWYCSLQLGKHCLEDFRVEYVYYRRQDKLGRPQRKVWVARPRVRIHEEDRLKDNEVIVGRPATVSVLMYYKTGPNVSDWKIVLVEEYRAAVMNYRGRVLELPGGSIEPLEGPFDERTVLGSALREVEEETGLSLDASRLREAGVRQGLSTLVVCEHHLYTYELDEAELGYLEDAPIGPLREIHDNDENTSIRILRVDDLLGYQDLPEIDWLNMGMIMKFIALQRRPFRSRNC